MPEFHCLSRRPQYEAPNRFVVVDVVSVATGDRANRLYANSSVLAADDPRPNAAHEVSKKTLKPPHTEYREIDCLDNSSSLSFVS